MSQALALALKAGVELRSAGSEPERRYARPSLRASTGPDGPTFSGYAVVYNSLSASLGWFKERIDPRAGARSLREDDIVSLWNHNPDYPLGRTANGRLKLRSDGHGLHMAVAAAPTSYALDLALSVADGTVAGQSFSFTDTRDRWTVEDGSEVRTLLDYRYLDVSPVTFPAYRSTDVQVRGSGLPAYLTLEASASGLRAERQFRAAVDARNRAYCSICGASAAGGSVTIDWPEMRATEARCVQHVERRYRPEIPSRARPAARGNRPRLAAARRRLEAIPADIDRVEAEQERQNLLRRRRLLSLEHRAAWSGAYINALPDWAFLYIEPGGSKDSEGKTVPRRLRHFPYKDAGGSVDLPHLRNALQRIPQSDLPASVKASVLAKARRIAAANGVGA